MIRLGFRLALSGPRATMIAAGGMVGVAAGTAILLLALSWIPAVSAREDRTSWMESTGEMAPLMEEPSEPSTWLWAERDYIGSWPVDVVTVAPATDDAPVPPGISTLPADGEAYVSPSLAALLDERPAADGRYGDLVGTIGDEALSSPDALTVVRGMPADELAPTAMLVTVFKSSPNRSEVTLEMTVLIAVGAVAVLAPTVLFVVSMTRLSAASRDRRLAALRLAGAGPSQVRMLALVESTIVGMGGVALGTGLFFLLRPLIANITFDGDTFFPADLAPGPVALAGIMLGVVAMVATAASLTLRRVVRRPLGVWRRTPVKRLRWWRLLPVVAAFVALYALQTHSVRSMLGGSSDRAIAMAFALVFVGVVLAGPLITRMFGLLLARWGRAGALLAGRRLAEDPRGGFRAVAGIVFAVLAVSAFVTMTPAAAESIEDQQITGIEQGAGQADVFTLSAASSERLADQLRDQSGISGVALVYQGSLNSIPSVPQVWMGSCAEIVKATGWSDVPCGAAPVLVAPDLPQELSTGGRMNVSNLKSREPEPIIAADRPSVPPPVIPMDNTAPLPNLTGIDVPSILVDTDLLPEVVQPYRPNLLTLTYTDAAALERARSAVVASVPNPTLMTRETTFDGFSSDVRALYDTATVVTALIVTVATISLVISVTMGLLERRLPFALLRAAGTPLRTLRLTMFLEAAVPLVIMTGISLLVGYFVGWWAVSSTGSDALPAFSDLLWPSVWAVLAAMAVIGCALPMVRRATETEQVRFD